MRRVSTTIARSAAGLFLLRANCHKIVLDKPGPGDDERAGDVCDESEELVEQTGPRPALRTFATANGQGNNTLRSVLPEPEEFSLALLDSQDMDNAID